MLECPAESSGKIKADVKMWAITCGRGKMGKLSMILRAVQLHKSLSVS